MPSPVTEAPFVFSPSGSLPSGPSSIGAAPTPGQSTRQNVAASGVSRPAASGPAASGPATSGPAAPMLGGSGGGNGNARHEIAAIVREVAQAVGSERNTGQYAAFLVDRIYRATSALHVRLWRFDAALTHSPAGSNAGDLARLAGGMRLVRRCGPRPSRKPSSADQAAHRRLIAEVIAASSPVVVPPSPADEDDAETMPATDPIGGDDPAGRNPFDMPLAIVPVPTAHAIDHGYVLELAMDADTPTSAWKPHLRFMAQVADLAGQFYVIESLRRLTRLADYTATINRITDRIEPTDRSSTIREKFVDQVASEFDLRRVAWMVRDGRRWRASAVNHCEVVDPDAAGSKHLATIAGLVDQSNDEQRKQPSGWVRLGDSPMGWTTVPGIAPDHLLILETDVDASLVESLSLATEEPEGSGDDSVPQKTRPSGTTRDDIIRAEPSSLIDPSFLRPMSVGLDQTVTMESLARRVERIPLARFWVHRPGRPATRLAPVGIALTIIAAMLFFFPMPQNVLCPMQLQPSMSQTVVCTRNCIVESVEVHHGQSVTEGQLLVRLRDPELQQQRLESMGRLNVLRQRRDTTANQLVDPTTPRQDYRRLEDDQTLLETQIAGIEHSLDVLAKMIANLNLYATRDGVIDAWRASEDLPGRPVDRGQTLMRVVDQSSPWHCLAKVPRHRIAWLHEAVEQESLRASASADGSTADKRNVRLSRYGPPVAPEETLDNASSMWVEFELDAKDMPNDPAWRTGVPGQIMIQCGDVSLGRWIAGDLIQWTRQQRAAWMGIWEHSK